MSEMGLQPVPGGTRGFAEAVSATYFPFEMSSSRHGADLQGAIATRAVGPITMVGTYISGPFHGRRPAARRGEAHGRFVLMLLEQTEHLDICGSRAISAGRGNLLLLNADLPMETQQRAGGTTLALSLPAAMLTSRFADVEDWCLQPLDTTEGAAAVLRASLLACWRSRHQFRSGEEAPLAASLIQLIGAAFSDRSSLPVFSSHAAKLHFLRVRDLVRANLERADLAPDFVADRLGISRSYLFTIMNAAQTTLGRLILEQRLQQARALLTDPQMGYRSISEIAFSVGFQDLSHFSRRFAEQYGHSPRACRPQPEATPRWAASQQSG